MIGGVYGKILHINLHDGTTRVEHLPEPVYRLLVGGRALIAYFLLRDLAPHTDSLSPDNLLIFAPGILQGTNLPGAGRHSVGAKSPLTGAIASSEAGGWLGHELKRTGFDALVVHGRAPEPVYLWVHDGQAEIRPAAHLWGKLTAELQAAIRLELGDDGVRVAGIGPGGENQVLYASVMHDVNRASGRNGLGAVMGSKNLKAVAVRGRLSPPILDRKQMAATARWLGENYRQLSAWAAEGLGRGTQDVFEIWANLGGLPTRNFSQPVFDQVEALSGEHNYEMFFNGRDTCQACPVHCKQIFAYEDGDPRHTLHPEYGGPEYEAMAAFGSNCGVTDNRLVSKANELANAYGLDAISTGATIAFVMECFENGLLTSTETGGLELRFGNGEAMLAAIELIAHRRGFGNSMAQGVNRLSAGLGPETEAFNLTVKGQELPMHEPRLKHGMGIGYAVAPVGADHMMNIHDTDYVQPGEALARVNAALSSPVQPLSAQVLNEDKLQILYREAAWMHFQDCAVCCHFYPYRYEHLAAALSGITGVNYTIQDILAVGERAQTLSRLFNLREGFTAEDDRLPARVRKAFTSGPLKGIGITDEAFSWSRRRFYELMQWHPETGVPTQACLQALALDQILI
jgi:aldehyde:ferredoxin oxidoreductase